MSKQAQPEKPTYTVATVTISSVISKTPEGGKPYLAIEGLESNGNSWIFRLYTTDKARPILKWFLAKFGYPAELMEPLQLKKSKIIGLEGKVLFEESSERQWPQAVGFARLDETELEDRVARMNVPAVDINEDLRKELECLDNL